MPGWNLWHGCTKISPGCQNCYMYRNDEKYGKDPSVVVKTTSFDLPIKKNRQGEYKIQDDGDFVYTCFTSDFFHPAADEWRIEAWHMMKIRSDLKFLFITKRPDRFYVSLPDDWGEGYENVHICCTCENQQMADARLPVFLELPIRHKSIIHEPMLGPINIEPYLASHGEIIEQVVCGGESGPNARLCDYDWILSVREQCMRHNVSFHFKQTGANFKRGTRVYSIPRRLHHSQAKKAGIDFQSHKGTVLL